MHELNEDILDKEIRLIGAEGQQLGIMSSQEALKIADEQGLDLVKISPQAVPPVCKLMNYGKFRFEQSKKEKEARKNQHVVEIKEIRLSPGIDVGDFNTNLQTAQQCIAHPENAVKSLHNLSSFGPRVSLFDICGPENYYAGPSPCRFHSSPQIF
mgnify:CR=1 FL=1